MTEPTPEPEILTVGKPPRDSDGSGPRETGTLLRLLPALWLVTAAALVVAPFLSFTKYEIRQDGKLVSGYEANGWGNVNDLADAGFDSHGPRYGIVLVLLAVALLLAAGATVWHRAATWPTRVGVVTGIITITTAVVLILDQEALLSNEMSTDSISYDVSPGLGVGVVIIAAVAAGVALAIVLVNEHREALQSRQRREQQWTETSAE